MAKSDTYQAIEARALDALAERTLMDPTASPEHLAAARARLMAPRVTEAEVAEMVGGMSAGLLHDLQCALRRDAERRAKHAEE